MTGTWKTNRPPLARVVRVPHPRSIHGSPVPHLPNPRSLRVTDTHRRLGRKERLGHEGSCPHQGSDTPLWRRGSQAAGSQESEIVMGLCLGTALSKVFWALRPWASVSSFPQEGQWQTRPAEVVATAQPGSPRA